MIPACSIPARWRAEKSVSCVNKTRPSAWAYPSWSRSEAPINPASRDVVTSMPRSRRSRASAPRQVSSRWNRIVLGIVPGLDAIHERGLPGFQIGGESLFLLDESPDLVSVVVIIGQRRIDVGQRQ